MSDVLRYTHTDYEGDAVRVEAPEIDTRKGTVGYLKASPHGAYVDREGAVGIIEALTHLVEEVDAAEASKPNLYKRGEIVYGVAWGKFRILDDEVEGNYFDVVVLSGAGFGSIYAAGDILSGYGRIQVRRTPVPGISY